MKPAYLNLPVDHHFDYAYLMHILKSYHSPRDKVTQMLEKGEIIRIKKGLYIRSSDFGGHSNINEIANALYGPSYLSLEYALSRYSLIPERVVEVTSVTPKGTKFFQTPVGNFSYHHIMSQAFSSDVQLVEDENARYLIASKEKALCDKVALASNIRTMKSLEEYLYDNLRIDPEDLKDIDADVVSDIKNAYNSNRIALLVRLLKNVKPSKKG